MEYRSRVVDGELARRLAASGAVVIEGPRACGKTETARQQVASEVLLDVDRAARAAASFEPGLVLEGATPRLIDEWQIVPEIWNHIRRAIDDRREPGQFVLTGSAVPADDTTRHTGAGRLTRLRMRPMSLYETGVSTGAVSMAAILAGSVRNGGRAHLTFNELFEVVCTGGWPSNLGRSPQSALDANRAYLDEIRRTDINRVDGMTRDPERVGRLMRSYARNVSTSAAIATIAEDTGGSDGPIKDHTAIEYIGSLTRLMIIEDQPAWSTHLRSSSVLRKAPRRHFVDPSLAVAALRASPQTLRTDLELFGLLFESLVIRDLRVYAQSADADVLHYRDSTGLEVDAIIASHAGPWAAFEVKLGGRLIDEGAANLATFARRMDTRRSGAPAMLGVIVGGEEYAYCRQDGVWVLPIGVLGP